MSHGSSPLAAFQRTGDRSRLPEPAGATLRPALFAAYGDLAALRGDFPLLLSADAGERPWLQSLADAVDAALAEAAPGGAAGEPVRRQALAVEDEIRQQAAGTHGPATGSTLGEAWAAACSALGLDDDKAALTAVRERLPGQAELVGCDENTAPTILQRAWRAAEARKARRLADRVQRLAQRLSDILLADRARSAEAREAQALEKSLGGADRAVFDFEAMARILRKAPAADPLPEARRQRIRSAIAVLQQQRFVGDEAWSFVFSDCDEALAAWRQRLPALRDLVRAMAVAELELGNRYVEEQHDRFFEQFDETRLGPGDLEGFPGCLLLLRDPDRAERNRALALLEAEFSFKIVIQVTDLIDSSIPAPGAPRLGRQAQNIARMALGLDDVFVFQCSNAFLYRLRDAALRGMAASRPALFSLYAGPGYLASAAAVEGRAFPCFVFDPGIDTEAEPGPASDPGPGTAGPQRFSLDGNPRTGTDWPRHSLAVEDSEHGRHEEEFAFTFADCLAADARFLDHFVPAPGEADAQGGNELVPLADYLERDEEGRRFALPFVPLVDGDGILRRAVVDERIVEAAARCRAAWRRLQELGLPPAVPAEPVQADAQSSEQTPAAATEKSDPAAVTQVQAPPPPAEAADEESPDAAPPSDDPWIETLRCTTCHECRQVNDRMFAYDADQRAYIADPDAGSYRELVEAAEACQVAIIHPGKPRNPDEPGLEELLQRAEPFL